MSVNKYKPHLLILPEDDANRQIATGFILDINVNKQAIKTESRAKGWLKAIKKLEDNFLEMQTYPQRRILLLIDFDDKEDRLTLVKGIIPNALTDRVFVISVLSEPEKLKSATQKSYEKIGEALAKDCSDNTYTLWNHPLLQHNKPELDRMKMEVKPFLFDRD